MTGFSRNYPVLIGSVGWRHRAWQDSYYPADLPPEWQLGYYANEFPVVLVPAAERLDEDCEVEELDLHTVFELQAADAEQARQQLSTLPVTASRSVLLRSTPTVEPARLDALLAALEAEPLVVDFGTDAPAPSLQTVLRRRRIGWCWHGGGQAHGLESGPLGIVRLASDGITPLQLRQILETCLAVADPARRLILLLEGTPPAVATLRQAQTILDLL